MHKKRHQSRYAEIINPSAKKYLNQCTLCGRVGLAPSTMETDYDATSGDKTIKEQQELASLVKSIAIKQLGKQYAPLPLDADGHCEMCANVAIRQKA